MRSEQWQRHPVTYTWSPLSSSIHPLRSPSTRFSSQTAATQQRCLHPADTKASLPARAWRLRSRPESLPTGAGLPRPSRPKLPVTDEQAPTGRCSASTRPTSAPHTPADLHRFSCRLLRSVPFTSTPHRAGPHTRSAPSHLPAYTILRLTLLTYWSLQKLSVFASPVARFSLSNQDTRLQDPYIPANTAPRLLLLSDPRPAQGIRQPFGLIWLDKFTRKHRHNDVHIGTRGLRVGGTAAAQVCLRCHR
jgi:hypothetical protein